MTNETKHTPGPLEYDPSNLCLYAPKGDGIVRVADLTPAETGDEQDEIPPDEVDANGRLFAASPELLEALKRIERTDMSTVSPEWLGNFCRAAIAKAEKGQS